MAGYICKIVMEDTHPPVWRRVVIPERITFLELHEIIQILFGWDDAHLHDFQIPADRIYINSDGETWGRHYAEADTLVDSFFRNYKSIRYTYDFGDDWRHKINIEQMDENYTERYAALLKFKGDNFQEDCGAIWEQDDTCRSAFDRTQVEERLKSLVLPEHENLQETLLLKESLKTLKDMFQKLSGMTPEVMQSVVAKTVQDMDGKDSAMKLKTGQWRMLQSQGRSLTLLPLSEKTQRELLMDLGEKEAADFYKYLRLPQDVLISKEEKVNAISETLQRNPEYLFYVFDQSEYTELTQWMGCSKKEVRETSSSNMVAKAIGLGLLDFIQDQDGGKICFAADISRFCDVVDTKTKKDIYRKLEKFDNRLGALMQIYGVIELESLFEIYKRLYEEKQDKEDFCRMLYWHARFNNFLNTMYQLDGTCYAALKEIDAQKVLEKRQEFAGDLPYAVYSKDEITYKAEDLTNCSDWIDILFSSLHYQLQLDAEEARDWLFEIVAAVKNGDTIDEIMRMLQSEINSNWSIEVRTDLWNIILNLMMELELPMLKGRSRVWYAAERKIPVWKIDIVSDEYHGIQNTKTCHMYQFPAEVQNWMYEAERYYDDDVLQKLYDYKKQHDICSEEYIYLLAEKYVAITDERKAEELILELKKSSAQMKKAAGNLEKDL